MIKPLTITLCALLLSGCALPDAPRPPAPEARCCTALPQLTPLQFAGRDFLRVTIDRATPLVKWHETARHARVVQLPPAAQQLTLTLPLTDDDGFLAAKVALYSADWQLLRLLTLQDFYYQPPGALHSHQMLARLALNDLPQRNAAWLVVYADVSQTPTHQALLPDSTLYAEKSHTVPLRETAKLAHFDQQGALEIRLHDGASPLSAVWPTTSAAPASEETINRFQQAIVEALRQQNYQQAAEIADRARQQGYPQASAWLVQQMRDMPMTKPSGN